MSYTFVGSEKRIYIDVSTPDVDVEDLYSRWKDWVLEGTNMQWLPAFRTFGGDVTIEGQTAPKYFFLINGWRVVVDGFDSTFATNLYTDEGDSAVITLNGATAQIKNSDAPIIEYVQGETTLGYSAEYIYVSGTTGSDEFGTGALDNPYATLAPAKVTAIEYNINKIFVLDGTHTLNGDFSNFSIHSYMPNISIILVDTGTYLNTSFHNVKLSGSMINGPITANNCDVNGLNGFKGYLIKCGINTGGIQFQASSANYLIDCYNTGFTINPVLDMNIAGVVKVVIRNYSGGIEISNMTEAADYVSLHLLTGNATINNSNTDGEIHIGGTVNLTDNSNGTTVNKSDTINEILGIDGNNLTVTVDEVAIADAVWSKQLSELINQDGTIGQHVSRELLTVIKYLALK